VQGKIARARPAENTVKKTSGDVLFAMSPHSEKIKKYVDFSRFYLTVDEHRTDRLATCVSS
jgi:hypothetical protein